MTSLYSPHFVQYLSSECFKKNVRNVNALRGNERSGQAYSHAIGASKCTWALEDELVSFVEQIVHNVESTKRDSHSSHVGVVNQKPNVIQSHPGQNKHRMDIMHANVIF
jgi:hypothetical protein